MAYTDLTADFAYRDIVAWGKMDQLAENDAYDHFVAGTRTFFYQVSAPAAWTKLTSQNDKILRVVSGAGGGSAGSIATSANVDMAHTHTVAHSHTHPAHTHHLDYVSGTGTRNAAAQRSVSDGDFIGNVSGGGASVREAKTNFLTATPSDTASASPSTDSQLSTFALKYADVIVCEKN